MTGAALRDWMTRNGYTNRSLSRALDVSRSTIERWLRARQLSRLVVLALGDLEHENGLAEEESK